MKDPKFFPYRADLISTGAYSANRKSQRLSLLVNTGKKTATLSIPLMTELFGLSRCSLIPC